MHATKDGESISIFSYLTGYVPTDKRESKEDFLTQAFAWILEQYPKFAYYYINFINKKICRKVDKNTTVYAISNGYNYKYEIETQRNLDGGHSRLDLLISTKADNDKKVYYICEHKVDSELSENQISRYMSLKSEINPDPSAEFYSILLTKDIKQHTQYADVKIVWGDVKELIDTFLTEEHLKGEKEYIFVLEQLSMYLAEKGLENAKPIDKSDLENHNFNIVKFDNDSCIEKTLSYFINRLKDDLDKLEYEDNLKKEFPNLSKLSEANYKLTCDKESWGRKGISIFGNEWDQKKSYNDVNLIKGAWKVGLFVGFLYSPRDHKIEPLDAKKGFDMVIILDGMGKCDSERINNAAFDNMTEILKKNSEDFSFIPFEELKNDFRLAVLRKSFMDVLSENGEFQTDIEKQYELFKKYAFTGMNLMANAYANK